MRPFASLLLTAVLMTSACAVGPDYVTPTTPTATAFKAPDGWRTAQPSDGLARGDWWTLFGDDTLNSLVARAETANQTIAAAEAAYRQARALTRETRAGLFPIVSLNGSGAQSKTTTSNDNKNYQVGIGATWEPDFWGRIRRSVEANDASAKASDDLRFCAAVAASA